MEIDSQQWRETVIDGALALGVTISVDQVRTMGRHATELLWWNQTTNLTAITDPMEVAVKHYVDSVAPISLIGAGVRVLDAGSGGGFPGIPLKIVRPDLSITLVDSVRKKVSFLKYATRTIGLKNVFAVNGRLEELAGLPEFHEKFDIVVCRAFSSLDDFVAVAAPFLCPGGCLLAMKGRETDHDHQALNHTDTGKFTLGGTSFSINIHRYRLPFLDAQRSLVLFTPRSDGGGQKTEV